MNNQSCIAQYRLSPPSSCWFRIPVGVLGLFGLLASILAAGLLSSCLARNDMMDRNQRSSSSQTPESQAVSASAPELVIPPLLDSSKGKVILRAQSASYSVGPTKQGFQGLPSATMGYNGPFLGPTILLRQGSEAEIEIANQLDEVTTFHSHGAHISGRWDGGPQRQIAPGSSWVLRFAVRQQAATLWYHPHPMGTTASQVWQGLAGLYIIEDENSKSLPLPQKYGVNDIPLIVQERMIDEQGRLLPYSRIEGHMTTMNGASGNSILVNGQRSPQLTVARGWLRLRLLNGSNASSYRFHFADRTSADSTRQPLSFYQIASGQGLLVRPVQLDSIDLTTGSRAELMLLLPKGEMAVDLKLSVWNRNLNAVDTNSYPVMSIRVDPTRPPPPKQVRLPKILRSPEQIDAGEQWAFDLQIGSPALAKLPRREIFMEMHSMHSMMGQNPYSIDGKSFDVDRIDFHLPQNRYEVWHFRTDMLGHPVHIHGLRFRVLQSAWQMGKKAGSPYWKDTFTLNTEGEALVLVQFTKTASAEFPYMLHCHMLEHEDAGMMAQFRVS